MAWICVTVLQRCSGSLIPCEQRSLTTRPRRERPLLAGKVPDGKQKVGRSRTTWRKREKAEAGWGGGGGDYWDQ